jgi:hypothetical protein
MRISTLIEKLQQVRRDHGDIEIDRLDGAPLSVIEVSETGMGYSKVVERVSLESTPKPTAIGKTRLSSSTVRFLPS